MSSRSGSTLFDRAFACVLIVALAPVLTIRALVGWYKTGGVFEKIKIHDVDDEFLLLKFASFSKGRNLACLFNIVSGNLTMVGNTALIGEVLANERNTDSRPQKLIKGTPCLINMQSLQSISGTKYEGQILSDLSVTDKLGILIRYATIKLMVPEKSFHRPDLFSILNVPVDNLTMDAAVKIVIENALEKNKNRIAFVNADCLNIAAKNEPYSHALQHKTRIFADGIGLQIGAQILGVELKENVNGTDLLPRLCVESIKNNLSFYFLGGKPGVAQEAANSLKNQFPGLQIAGLHHGYFPTQETDTVIQSINAANADIVLVAFGAPKQDLWIEQYAEDINAPILIGVGGLLDFQTNRISRSPKWVQDMGMEWIWRLKQEPLRLWKRYLIGNPLFLFRVHKQARDDINCINYKRFKNPYRANKSPNKRYIRKQYSWLLKFIMARIGKRVIDLFGSTIAFILLSPILILTGILIRIESPGPILFYQRRIGRYGHQFNMIKFRSMQIDAEKIKSNLASANEVDGGVTFKMKSDPRITRIGRYIRRYSLDELPQLINVMKGEMSLVGPRPPVPNEVDQYSGRDRRRLEVVPGITGLWQVSGRSDTSFEQQVDLDIDYLESHSFLQDIIIMFKTVPAVFSGRGAY